MRDRGSDNKTSIVIGGAESAHKTNVQSGIAALWRRYHINCRDYA